MKNALLLVVFYSLLPSGAWSQNAATFAQGRLPRAIKSTMTSPLYNDSEKYAGQWKMSSWNGSYKLFEDGRCTVVDPANPGNHTGIWFLAYDRLYLVWSWGPVIDVFQLNPDNHTILKRIDHDLKNITFEKKID